MKITRWDIAVVSAVAAASAAVFAGPGRGTAVAEGPAKAAPAKATPELGGCKITAHPSSDKPGTVVVCAENPGASEIALNVQIVVEQLVAARSGPNEAVSREALPASFKPVKVAEQTLVLTVPAGAKAEGTAAFTLKPGAYTVSAAGDGKKVALCSVSIPNPQVLAKKGS